MSSSPGFSSLPETGIIFVCSWYFVSPSESESASSSPSMASKRLLYRFPYTVLHNHNTRLCLHVYTLAGTIAYCLVYLQRYV